MTKPVSSSAFFALLLLLLVAASSGSNSNVAAAFQSLSGVKVERVSRTKNAEEGSPETSTVDVGRWLEEQGDGGVGRKMVVFGTYAADFNAIEYGQRLRYYYPHLLKEGKRVEKCAMIMNCRPSAALKLASLVDLPDDVEIWVDNEGKAGRCFGVGRGWLPDNADVNPFLKLFGMLWGLGAWATLPAVIGGYLGNPFVAQPWIEDALAVGQMQKRWPDTALEISEDSESEGDGGTTTPVVVHNRFEDLPLVGKWPRRPLELATLRLQSMVGISLKSWEELAPDDEALEAGVLTQLGGCLVVDESGKNAIYEWRDPGICAVANFEDILEKI